MDPNQQPVYQAYPMQHDPLQHLNVAVSPHASSVLFAPSSNAPVMYPQVIDPNAAPVSPPMMDVPLSTPSAVPNVVLSTPPPQYFAQQQPIVQPYLQPPQPIIIQQQVPQQLPVQQQQQQQPAPVKSPTPVPQEPARALTQTEQRNQLIISRVPLPLRPPIVFVNNFMSKRIDFLKDSSVTTTSGIVAALSSALLLVRLLSLFNFY